MREQGQDNYYMNYKLDDGDDASISDKEDY